MTVSVIIPLYNKAAHIRRAVDSVLVQTHGDFELIIVDDGSTDGSGDVVRQYADPRIRLVQQVNAGVSAARNRGIAEAKSELLSFLDADDEWSKDFLETVLALRAKFPEAGVWGTAYAEMHPRGQMRHLPQDEEIRRHTNGLLIDFFHFSVLMHQPIHASSMLVRKEALLKAGGYQVGLDRLEDTVMFFCLALRYPMAYCPATRTIYHLDAENSTGQWLWSGNFPFFEHARAYLRECGNARGLPEDVLQYLGYYHTGGLYRNRLAGNRTAMCEIIRDCQAIPGYRLKCFLWRPLVWIPHPLVIFAWKLQSRLRGHPGKLPPIRSIYRQDQNRKQKGL